MNKTYLQEYIEKNIPISRTLNFEIKEINNKNISIGCLYKDHINHKKSVFGGSISSMMTLTGWAKVKILMEDIDPKAEIVIQDSHVKFLKPVLSDFVAYSYDIKSEDMEKYIKIYNKFGRSRIKINISLREESNNDILAEFEGLFVAVKKSDKK